MSHVVSERVIFCGRRYDDFSTSLEEIRSEGALWLPSETFRTFVLYLFALKRIIRTGYGSLNTFETVNRIKNCESREFGTSLGFSGSDIRFLVWSIVKAPSLTEILPLHGCKKILPRLPMQLLDESFTSYEPCAFSFCKIR